jgi:hypothetical protein
MIKVEMQDQMVRILLNAAEDAISPRALMEFNRMAMWPYLQRHIAKTISDGESGAWPPLTSATEAARMEDGFAPGPANRETGKTDSWLINSVKFTMFGLGAGLEVPDLDSADAEIRLRYTIGQFGNKANGTPARPRLVVPDSFDADAVLLLMAFFKGRMQATGVVQSAALVGG